MPSAPEFPDRFGNVGILKVFGEMETEYFTQTDCHIRLCPSYYMDGRTTILFVIAVLACGPWKRIFQIKDGFALCLVRRLILLILLAL